MENPFAFDLEQVNQLYGPVIYLIEAEAKSPAAPIIDKQVEQKPKEEVMAETQPVVENAAAAPKGIQWRPKPSSKLLFVLHQAELKDKELTELLKKIVASIGIPFESAGFGVIHGPVQAGEFEEMPNPYAVVFDQELQAGGDNPRMLDGKEVYFSHRLAALNQDKALKKELWSQLQQIQPKIS